MAPQEVEEGRDESRSSGGSGGGGHTDIGRIGGGSTTLNVGLIGGRSTTLNVALSLSRYELIRVRERRRKEVGYKRFTSEILLEKKCPKKWSYAN